MEYTQHDTIVELKDVSLSFGENLILRDINLEIKDVQRVGVEQGQVVSLLAPSGVGKTQLLKIIAGLNTPTTGTVRIGQPLAPVKTGEVGVVQQNFPLFDHETVMGNLEIAGRKYAKAERKERIDSYLNHFGLTERKNLYPAQLSGGQKQRVAIAQALLSSEHFLLLDEPFSGLDVNMIDRVSEMIIQISQLHELNTIIIVSHDISSTCAISDTVWLLGKDQNEDGTWKPGARIKTQYDLMKEGLAWQQDIRNMPRFSEFTKEVRNQFKYLS